MHSVLAFVLMACAPCAAFNTLLLPTVDYNCSALAAQGAFQTYSLRTKQGMEARFIPYGATLTHLLIPDASGVARDVVLGFDNATDYCAYSSHPYFGAAIGRVANRIANCSFDLNGRTYKLSCNENVNSTVPDTLHGGVIGYDRRVWTVERHDDQSILFSLFSPDGEMGFPGDLFIHIEYRLNDETNAWEIRYSAESGSQDTVVALTQHTYWNLNANINNTQTVLDHQLYIDAGAFLEVDKELLPTGELASVDDAPWMNFLTAKSIGKDIANGTVTPTGGYDNAFVFNDWTHGQAPTLRVVLASPLSGIAMTMKTDQPSVQFYSGNFLDGTIPRKADQTQGSQTQYYQHYGAAALEAQYYPDSVHHPNFPSILLKSQQTYTQFTSYEFDLF